MKLAKFYTIPLARNLTPFKPGVFLLLFLLNAIGSVTAQTVVFRAGEKGYKSFRIPAIVKLGNGNLLAFCEARKSGGADFGNIDIVVKRSRDKGKTWSDMQVVVDNDSLQAGNPAPVVDMLDPAFPKGRLLLFYNTGNNHEAEVRKAKGLRECWMISSIDGGITWSTPKNITTQVHRPYYPTADSMYNFKEDWRSYANTPGHAVQIESGTYKGRIFIAANHSSGEPKPDYSDYSAHGYFTDDHGSSFRLSQTVPIPGSNESIAVELPNSGLLMSSRNQKGDIKRRIMCRSSDGGEHWDTVYFENSLKDPVCQASMIGMWHKGNWIIFHSNNDHENRRDRLTLAISKDNGQSWPIKLLIDADANGTKGDYTAYSDLVIISPSVIGVLYEKENYSSIVFKELKWR